MMHIVSGSRKGISRCILLGCLILLISLVGSSQVVGAQGHQTSSATNVPGRPLPPNRPERGLIYDGLEALADGTCKGLYRIKQTQFCTHGPDSPPNGLDIKRDVQPIATAATSLARCDGDGVSGTRTEVIYARAANVTDRYSAYLASFRQWASDVDTVYQNSAAATGGSRRIRFVHDSTCTIVVRNVILSTTGDDDFAATRAELQAQGYNRLDRAYLVFVDAHVYCGIATMDYDDQPGQGNVNNSGPAFARIDNACWDLHTVAHEHMHMLGGVQPSAPHTTGGGHCTDEYDVMCYSDRSYTDPPMQYLCSNQALENAFDCNHDDYYHTDPPAYSYLATHWNVANSPFLFGSSPPLTHSFVSANRRDFNGDGRADILWHTYTTGENNIWLMNGSQIGNSASVKAVPELVWQVAGLGDFNADGKTDILWRRTTGENHVWFLNGAQIASEGSLPVVAESVWQIRSVADFNGDSYADILWRRTTGENHIWLMNGARVVSEGSLPVVAESVWHIVGTGNFNGDSYADILWRRTTGENVIWFMNGARVASTADLPAVPEAVWQVAGLGDFNADSKTDLLWHRTTGENVLWLMDGSQVVSSASVPTAQDPAWQIKTVSDFNGDRKVDILWWRPTFDPNTGAFGETFIWFMDGSRRAGEERISTLLRQVWQIIP